MRTIDNCDRDAVDRRVKGVAGVDTWALAASSLASGSAHGPDATTISDYEKAVAKVAPRDAVILGATPALRRLLRRVAPQLDLVCVDRSLTMLEASREVLQTRAIKERFIRADWLDLSEALAGPVDLVIGDMALDNLWFANWPVFFDQVALSLRDGGNLILGVGTAGAGFEAGDCAAVLDAFEDGGRTGTAARLWRDLEATGAIGYDVTIPELRVARYSRALQTQILGHDPSSAVDRAVGVLSLYERRMFDAVWSRFTCEDVVRAAHSRFRLKSPTKIPIKRGDARLPLILCFQRDGRAQAPAQVA